MVDSLFLPLKHELKLEYTYKLSRGKLPEKVYLQKDRYSIINFNSHNDKLFYANINDYYFCGIYDSINKTYLKIYTRYVNNKIIEKTINLHTLENKVIKQTYYIPICVKLLGDPKNIKSISIDHIDVNNTNDSIANLRWATCYEQNNNKTSKDYLDEYDDWIYVFENTHYDSVYKLYTYLKNTNKIYSNIPPKRFRDQLQKSCKKGKLTYKLLITRYIKQMNEKGAEVWKELDPKLELKKFKYISNYGRLGSIYNNIIIPRTISIDKYGYMHLKLKSLKSFIAIHTLVYIHFIGQVPDGYIVDHIDENKTNNHISNLNILTTSENVSKTMITNKEHKATVNITLENIETKEIMSFNTKQSCADHFDINVNTLNYKIKTAVDNIFRIKDIEYRFTLRYKKDYYQKSISSPKIIMTDMNGTALRNFYSSKEVYAYYKSNGYAFSPDNFKKILNINKEYNIPNILWITP